MRRGRQRCQEYFANRGYFTWIISESFEWDSFNQRTDYTANRTLKRTGLEKNSQHYLLSKVMRTNVTKVTKLWHLMTVWKFKVLRIRYEHYWSEFNHGWPHSTADDRNWPPVISSNGSERVKNCQFRQKLWFWIKFWTKNDICLWLWLWYDRLEILRNESWLWVIDLV